MTLVAAVDALEAISYTGITHLDQANVRPVYELPALVLMFGQSGEGFGTWLVSGDGRLVIEPEHWLVVAQAAHPLDLGKVYDSLAQVDNYLAALRDNMTLGGALATPLSISEVRLGMRSLAGVVYLVWVFKHRWEIVVT